MSFFTSFCDLPQNEQQRSSSGLRKLAIERCRGLYLFLRRTGLAKFASCKMPLHIFAKPVAVCQLFVAVFDNLVDEAVVLCLNGREDTVAFDVEFDLVEGLAAVVGDDTRGHLTHTQDLLGHDADVRRLA